MQKRPIPGLRAALARPRLFISIASGFVVWLLVPKEYAPIAITRFLVGWNAGALLYMCLALVMMVRSDIDHMRYRAEMQDEGEYVVLALVICAAIVTLGAIAVELSTAKDLHGWVKIGHVSLAGLTVFTTWSVTQVMFALHYAHNYYVIKGSRMKGLDFPGGEPPDYLDFLYASCIIGTSAQTADVSFNTRTMRRVGLLHSVLSFFFNTILLALTINLASGLL
jgi:uncharacterized membrane protein